LRSAGNPREIQPCYNQPSSIYRDGKVELAEAPKGIHDPTSFIVTFLNGNGAPTVELQAHGINEQLDSGLPQVVIRMISSQMFRAAIRAASPCSDFRPKARSQGCWATPW
jgi:hypothetical protein